MQANFILIRPVATVLHIAAMVLAFTPALAAAVTTFTFSAQAIGEGPYSGRTYLGSFSYDPSVLSNSGLEIVDVSFGSLTITFDFEGHTFDEKNDVDYSDLPSVDFVDGQPTFIDYWLVSGVNGVTFADPSVREVLLAGPLLPVPGGTALGLEATVGLVPEPASAAMLGLGVAIVGLTRLRRARHA